MKRLSIEEVKEIKFLLLWSWLTHKEIARYMKTSVTIVMRIKHGYGQRYSQIDID